MEPGAVGDAERVVRFLVETARCGECGSAYHAEDVYVLDQLNRRVWELAAVCPGCLSVWLVKAVMRSRSEPEGEPESVPHGRAARAGGSRPLNELTLAERRHFSSLEPIDQDDVLDVSAFLSTFDGDFRSYFGQEPEGRE